VTKFYTKDGYLTRYALACGYRHATESDGFSCYLQDLGDDGAHVVVETWRHGATQCRTSYGAVLRDGIEYREAFASIADARKAYRNQAGNLLRTRVEHGLTPARTVFA
jgi:hypothetical protein